MNTNTKLKPSILPTDLLVDMIRDMDSDSPLYWTINAELTRRDWFWINSDESGE